jgi:hypothetical protein
MKTKVILKKIVKITAGKMHAWCDSNMGLIRKPMSSIPDNLKK